MVCEKGVKEIDYCRECLLRWLRDEGIEPSNSPYSFQGRSLVIHDLDDPRGSCVFCKDMDSLQWCSICCEPPYARSSPANPAFDDLSPYYFDDRVGRVVPTYEDEARTALIEESLAKGDLEGVTALLVKHSNNNDSNNNNNPNNNNHLPGTRTGQAFRFAKIVGTSSVNITYHRPSHFHQKSQTYQKEQECEQRLGWSERTEWVILGGPYRYSLTQATLLSRSGFQNTLHRHKMEALGDRHQGTRCRSPILGPHSRSEWRSEAFFYFIQIFSISLCWPNDLFISLKV